MRLLFFILLNVFITCLLSGQGVTKNGQSTSTGTNFVDKTGKIVSTPALSKYGQELIQGSITTAAVSSITNTTAISGGNIVPDGGGAIISRGVCWARTANPTIANSRTTDGSGSGSFTSNITGLASGTTYYVRAYATNEMGTSYGSQLSFTTLSKGITFGVSIIACLK